MVQAQEGRRRQEKYSVIRRLDEGGQGTAYHVRSQENQKEYVIKRIKNLNSIEPKMRELVLQEAKILQVLDHPNIIAFHRSFIDKKD